MKNPFEVHTPENLNPKEVAQLFENVFADIPVVRQVGHTFIHGPRGSGKSMMFRYLLPEVQKWVAQLENRPYSLKNLEQLAIHVPVKSTDITQDLARMPKGSAYRTTLGDHYLSITSVEHILHSLEVLQREFEIKDIAEQMKKLHEMFLSLSYDFGIDTKSQKLKDLQPLNAMRKILNQEKIKLKKYLRTAPQDGTAHAYKFGFTSFLDYVLPILEHLKTFAAEHFFLMFDDADLLDEELQKVLNTWVSHRTTAVVSIKISTQLRYATYQTLSGTIVESPHDFNSADLTQIYTSRVDHYEQRVEKIVAKRLKYYGFKQSPYEFFPLDEKQQLELLTEEARIKELHATGERKVSSRVNDDVYRYLLPNFMANLQKSKKSNIFSYSGFKTIVNLSSGVIRLFLEPASIMYAECEDALENKDLLITHIPPQTQNKVLREWSTRFFMEEIKNIEAPDDEFIGLRNLIDGLGNLFGAKLLDEKASERRVFSVFLDEPPKDLAKIINLGVSNGYFQRSSIRSKEKTGRKLEIIFNRRLAPHFYLDPTGYSGRLSVTVEALRLAMRNPKRFVSERLKTDDTAKNYMGSLFDDTEDY